METIYTRSSQPRGKVNLMKTTVVNIRTTDDYDVYIGRGSRWGNPFRIGQDGTRAEVIEKYRRHLFANPELMDAVGTLRGQRLGCFCHPLACHGDVLAAIADRPD